MGGKAVPQRMNTDTLGNAGTCRCHTNEAVELACTHMLAAVAGKQPGVAGTHPPFLARRAQERVDGSRPPLAVSRLPRPAYECTPAPPPRSYGSGTCRHYQACRCSYAAAQLCHPSIGTKDRY